MVYTWYRISIITINSINYYKLMILMKYELRSIDEHWGKIMKNLIINFNIYPILSIIE
jgi:hypothetical protein